MIINIVLNTSTLKCLKVSRSFNFWACIAMGSGSFSIIRLVESRFTITSGFAMESLPEGWRWTEGWSLESLWIPRFLRNTTKEKRSGWRLGKRPNGARAKWSLVENWVRVPVHMWSTPWRFPIATKTHSERPFAWEASISFRMAGLRSAPWWETSGWWMGFPATSRN